MADHPYPTVGRIVNYVLPPGAAGGSWAGEIRPLIVTQVWENGAVNGHVVLNGQNDIGHDDHAYMAAYRQPEAGTPHATGTWHWPPRV